MVYATPSDLATANRCKILYNLTKIQGKKSRPGVAAMRGIAYHEASRVNFKQKLMSGIDIPLEDMKDAARSSIKDTLDDGVYIGPDDRGNENKIIGQNVDHAITLIEGYAISFAPTIIPIMVETAGEFLINKLDMTIGLRFDLVAKNLHSAYCAHCGKPKICEMLPDVHYVCLDCLERLGLEGANETRLSDSKTTVGKVRSQADADNDPGLTGYDIFLETVKGKKPDRITLDNMVFYRETKKPARPERAELVTITTNRTDVDRRIFLNMVEELQAAVKLGNYPRPPIGFWQCSPKWCGFYESTCKPKGFKI